MDEVRALLRDRARRFREAILAQPRLAAVGLEAFRRDACGDAVLLLGQYLYDAGMGEWTYTSGCRCSHTHAWIERHGLIIDITADQFDDVDEPVIVTTDHSWHDQFTLIAGSGQPAWLDAYDFGDESLGRNYPLLRRRADTSDARTVEDHNDRDPAVIDGLPAVPTVNRAPLEAANRPPQSCATPDGGRRLEASAAVVVRRTWAASQNDVAQVGARHACPRPACVMPNGSQMSAASSADGTLMQPFVSALVKVQDQGEGHLGLSGLLGGHRSWVTMSMARRASSAP